MLTAVDVRARAGPKAERLPTAHFLPQSPVACVEFQIVGTLRALVHPNIVYTSELCARCIRTAPDFRTGADSTFSIKSEFFEILFTKQIPAVLLPINLSDISAIHGVI